MGTIKRNSIVGQRIVEYLPSHDYATIVLDNGRELEVGTDEDYPVAGPKHPKIVSRIFNLERKLYEVTYGGKEDKAKQKEYKKQITELKKSLVGRTLSFCGGPCLVTKVISDKKTDTDYVTIEQNNGKRKIELYSLE